MCKISFWLTPRKKILAAFIDITHLQRWPALVFQDFSIVISFTTHTICLSTTSIVSLSIMPDMAHLASCQLPNPVVGMQELKGDHNPQETEEFMASAGSEQHTGNKNTSAGFHEQGKCPRDIYYKVS